MLSVKLLLTALIASSLFVGCTSRTQQIDINAIPDKITPLELPMPEPVTPLEVNFNVITPKNAEKVFVQIKRTGEDPVLYGLTDTNYKNLANNLDMYLKIIVEQRAIIEAYKNYYEPKQINKYTVK